MLNLSMKRSHCSLYIVMFCCCAEKKHKTGMKLEETFLFQMRLAPETGMYVCLVSFGTFMDGIL